MNAPATIDLPFHPLAAIFPLIDGPDFDRLRDDIAAHGVREPVVLFEGAILDGRNRYRASQAAGVDCPMTEYRGDDPAAYVVSLNLHRRHLTESQRAMAAAKLANIQRGGDRKSDQTANLQFDRQPAPVSQSEAASLLNVSPRTVATAKKVQDAAAPETVHAVEKGDLSVSLAAKAAALPKEQQAQIVTGAADKAALRRSVLAAVEDARQGSSKPKNPLHRADPLGDRVLHLSSLCEQIADMTDLRQVALWNRREFTAARLRENAIRAREAINQFLEICEAHDA